MAVQGTQHANFAVVELWLRVCSVSAEITLAGFADGLRTNATTPQVHSTTHLKPLACGAEKPPGLTLDAGR
jgi:hypothetical protein